MSLGDVKAAIVATHLAHPDWSCPQIAREVGCHPAYVRTMKQECSLDIPTVLKARKLSLALPGSASSETKSEPPRKRKYRDRRSYMRDYMWGYRQAHPGEMKPGKVKKKPRARTLEPVEPRVSHLVLLEPKRVTLIQLTDNICKYAVDDDPPYTFCGNDAEPDRPYCAYHCSIAYVVPPPRTRKRSGYLLHGA